MPPISVMLVDDNPTFLRVTTQFLEAHEGIAVIGTADGGEQALEKAQALQPQIILIDLAMPNLPGLKAIPRLRKMLPQVGIIALTVMNTKSFQDAALKAGADTFIPKSHMRTKLLPAIRQLTQSGGKMTPEAIDIPNKRQDSRRILIIEDDDYLRRLYGKALSKAGYDIHPAGTIQEARDLLTQVRFDLLLCDIHMGKARGTDLLTEYADTLFTSGAQVVMVSGQAQYRDMCEEMGIDFFLEKPVAMSTLVALADRLT
ncbi:MAG: hypothetical protein DRJ03_30390, partial [Chloroflexi bacterium]